MRGGKYFSYNYGSRTGKDVTEATYIITKQLKKQVKSPVSY